MKPTYDSFSSDFADILARLDGSGMNSAVAYRLGGWIERRPPARPLTTLSPSGDSVRPDSELSPIPLDSFSSSREL